MNNFKFFSGLFIANIIACIFTFPAYPQSFSLMPKNTESLDKREQKQGEITIKTNRFHSQSSTGEIKEFYKQMFSNEGFSEAKQSGQDKGLLIFTKANSIISLNFVPDYEDKAATYYYIQVQELPKGVKIEEGSIPKNQAQKAADKEENSN